MGLIAKLHINYWGVIFVALAYKTLHTVDSDLPLSGFCIIFAAINNFSNNINYNS